MVSAYLLHARHEVVVYEAAAHVGGHTHTVDVWEGGRRIPVDTGFIVFNEPNYPNLTRLFRDLGVEARDTQMSFSVRCDRSGLEYSGNSLDALFIQRSNLLRPRFWGMLGDIVRFHREAPRLLIEGLPDTTTVADYLRRGPYRHAFVEHYLVPLGASLWSCPASRFLQFPMRFVVEFLDNHRMLQLRGRPQWKTVVGGSRAYVERLTHRFRQRIRRSTPVTAVRRRPHGVDVHAGGGSETFDEVILATHADQSLALVAGADAGERELLGCFPYERNEVVLHWDTTRLPSHPKAWASWNYRIPADPRGNVAVTYNMNRLQGLTTARVYCVSLNQGAEIDPRQVLRRMVFQHPAFIPGRDAAQAQHGQLIRRNRLSYCGAYWGFGFHEDGVESALRVAEAFDCDLEKAA
jgi:predicted NAD/FAD-binding protein